MLRDERLTVSFDRFPDAVVARGGLVSVATTRRTIDVESDQQVLARLADGLSAGETMESLTGSLPAHLRAGAQDTVVDLVGWDAVAATDTARARLSHHWSMRSARGRGRISPAELLDLTFTEPARPHDRTPVVELSPPAALPIDSLSTVLRQRRSPTAYESSPIDVERLGQLLGTACGITGELGLDERRLPLRAYPSPGALYAVDVHVVPANIDGLPDGVFRYDPVRHALVTVSDRPVDPVSFCLPDTRPVVRGVAAFIALSICLRRATRKYGDESYRILVAEAGCIAQNLILVARALGLRAGPFTGVFDALVDDAIGYDRDELSFVLGVLVGR